ncbi:MAG: transglycosylase domain-containing protein [Bdellovibrionales bacterium]
MSRKSLKQRLKLFYILFLVVICVFLFWAGAEVIQLKKSTSNGWFDPPTKFYTAPLSFKRMQKISAHSLSSYLTQSGLKERGPNQSLDKGEFTFLPGNLCEDRLGSNTLPDTQTCFLIVNEDNEEIVIENSSSQILKISKILDSRAIPLDEFFAPAILFTQMSQGKHVLRTHVKLSQIPRYCLDSILAIEDDRFLKHKGVSIRGILRAVITNIKTGRFSQGGSTLTQQLVKNKFLTSKKTLKRKVREAWLSVLLELILTKDQILESYLNYIYWGQSGPYAVHGIQEASQHYFGKDVGSLNLSECTLLTGAVKGPGIYGPHKKTSKSRQKEVLNRMLELDLISKREQEKALNFTPSIQISKSKKHVQAPYYVNAVLNELKNLDIPSDGKSIFTEMDLFAQKEMEIAVDAHLKGRAQGFEGSALIADNSRNSVIALTSGPSRSLNFNSALYGKRQIGSTAKPFVYLTALEQEDPELNPTTEILNTPFTYKYEGQKWTPKNYSSKNQPESVPMYLALAKSKNIPTVRMMSEFGYKKVYKNLIKYGFNEFSPITPSLALGSFEASPLELLGAYINLSLDSQDTFTNTPKFVRKILTEDNEILYLRDAPEISEEPMSSSKRMLLEMMKNTLTLGTAKRSKSLNLKGVYGGKTGTTNSHGDGWFASVSPDYAYVVWVGKAPYLTDKGRKITGASAALPIWMGIVRRLEPIGRFSEYDWPYDADILQPMEVGLDDDTPKVLLRTEH